ncbi:MAG TPA: glucuronate isomerase [Verrucomicrobiales bacterium]|nr:glucuronate isomerase [Verrucomicrobiales bacterium]
MRNTISDAKREAISAAVGRSVRETIVYDIHTHLYDPAFGELLLWGIEDQLVYHYLVAEAFRHFDIGYDDFWHMAKEDQAQMIWDALFVENSPLSEACRGVLTVLNRMGLDANQRDLPSIRQWFAEQDPNDYITRCMELAKVNTICMTNSPFDALETPKWNAGFDRDERFTSALRIDPLLLEWDSAGPQLAASGYEVQADLSGKTMDEVQRFLRDWAKRMDALYVMVSLPPTFEYPADTPCSKLIDGAILPFCRQSGLAFALMIGVKRGVNAAMQLAGDGIGKPSLISLENLCSVDPDNKFLCTVLSRESQHELCVIARKFRNLHIFGCWWFTNIPSLIEEMTRMRLDLVGMSFTAQHSDARVLDQIIYKWDHSREIIAGVLEEKYLNLAATGWEPSDAEIQRDVDGLFGGSFSRFLGH